MTEARPRHLARPVLLVALLALFASLVPAAPAQAQTSTDWDADNACPSSLPDSGFSDATGVHGHNIDCLAWFALTNGVTTTSYGTQQTIRRDQTASFVVRSLGRLVPSGFDLPARDTGAFSDVTGGPHRVNIEVLAGFDPAIAAGYKDGTYRPRNAVTRAQFASIVTRSLDHAAAQGLIPKLPPATSPFEDTRGSVHEGNIARLARAGIVKGKTSDRYDPEGSLTRGQAASILARVLGGLVDEEVLFQPRLLEGVVHDGTDTAPNEIGPRISGAKVSAAGFTEVSDTTDGQGRYAIWLQQPSTYTIDLTASGFAPQQRGVILPNDVETDLAMYRMATAPSAAVATLSDADDVTISGDGAYWIIDPGFDAGTADEIRLEYPAGLVIELGDAGTSSAWFSRDPGAGTSARIGADSGTHTLYYRLDAVWHSLEAEFDNNGTLIAVNGSAYDDPDAGS